MVSWLVASGSVAGQPTMEGNTWWRKLIHLMVLGSQKRARRSQGGKFPSNEAFNDNFLH